MKNRRQRYLVMIGIIMCISIAWVATAAAKTTFISIGTGGTGGIYYPYGGGVAEIWSKYGGSHRRQCGECQAGR